MKKNRVVFICSILLSITFVFASCKKKDETAPIVTLIGDAHIFHPLNEPYNDPGATANDDGSSIDVVIGTNTVEVNLIGEYKVVWTATDADGNQGSAERKVTVFNEANYLIGNYNIHVEQDSAGVIRQYDYTDMVLVSGNVNNQIWINNFNNYPNASVNCIVDTTSIKVVNQTVGVPPNQRTFSGQGFVETTTGNFQIQTMEIFSGPPTYNIQAMVTYIKQ